MPAPALVLDGHSRGEAARSAWMDRQTLSDWVHCYSERGRAVLTNLPNSGAPPRKQTEALDAAMAAEWGRQGSANSACRCTSGPSAS